MLSANDNIRGVERIDHVGTELHELFTIDEVRMSACDHLLCRHVMQLTRRRVMAPSSKTRIRTLVRSIGAGMAWKGPRGGMAN